MIALASSLSRTVRARAKGVLLLLMLAGAVVLLGMALVLGFMLVPVFMRVSMPLLVRVRLPI